MLSRSLTDCKWLFLNVMTVRVWTGQQSQFLRCFRKKNTLYIETEISVLKVRRGRRGVWAGAVVEVAQVSERFFHFSLFMFCSVKFLLLNCDVLQHKGLWSFLSSGLLLHSCLDLLICCLSRRIVMFFNSTCRRAPSLYEHRWSPWWKRGSGEYIPGTIFDTTSIFSLEMFLQMEEWGKLEPYFPISIVDIQYSLLSIFRITSLGRWNGEGRGLVRGGNRGWVASFFSDFSFVNFSFSFVCQVIQWGFNLFLSLNSFVTEVSGSGFHHSLHLPPVHMLSDQISYDVKI